MKKIGKIESVDPEKGEVKFVNDEKVYTASSTCKSFVKGYLAGKQAEISMVKDSESCFSFIKSLENSQPSAPVQQEVQQDFKIRQPGISASLLGVEFGMIFNNACLLKAHGSNLSISQLFDGLVEDFKFLRRKHPVIKVV